MKAAPGLRNILAYETTPETVVEAQKFGNLYRKIYSSILDGARAVKFAGKGMVFAGQQLQ